MSIKYRPEIDGLRAVAVLAVVFFHAGFTVNGSNPFQGGFVGVDVFFVISGYLITSIILREIVTGQFRFLDFYERRARRILPALFTVMLASIPFAWVYMLPKAMKEFSGAMLSSLAFVSNFWFWQEDSYWAEPGALKPLLHTWSLSVEEQYYLLFPILLILLYKACKKHMLLSFAVLFLVSMQIASYSAVNHPTAAFYLLPSRGWELLAGAVLAKLEMDRGRVRQGVVAGMMPALGVLLIGLSIALFTAETRHPSYITLAPVMGTLLIIWFCRKGEPVTRLLSSKPVVFVGLISYGFYLWHFPVFAFSLIKGGDISALDKLGWIVTALVLALISYRLVEKPFRDRVTVKTKGFVLSIGLVFALLVGTSAAFYTTNGAEFRLNDFKQVVVLNYWQPELGNRSHFETYPGCWWRQDWGPGIELFGECRKAEAEARKHTDYDGPNIMVVGDSNMSGMIPGLIQRYGRDAITERVMNGCLPIYVGDINGCNLLMKVLFDEVAAVKPDVLIIGGRYRNTRHLELLHYTISHTLADFDGQIAVFGPLPRWGEEDKSQRLNKRLRAIYFSEGAEQINSQLYLDPDPATFHLDRVARSMAADLKVPYLSPVAVLCKPGAPLCRAKVGEDADAISTYDYGHLTHKASAFMVNAMKEDLDRLMAR